MIHFNIILLPFISRLPIKTGLITLNVLAKRPPVEETASFLQSLISSHGPNYLEKLFGSKARDSLQPLGGVNKVAIALSGESLSFIN